MLNFDAFLLWVKRRKWVQVRLSPYVRRLLIRQVPIPLFIFILSLFMKCPSLVGDKTHYWHHADTVFSIGFL